MFEKDKSFAEYTDHVGLFKDTHWGRFRFLVEEDYEYNDVLIRNRNRLVDVYKMDEVLPKHRIPAGLLEIKELSNLELYCRDNGEVILITSPRNKFTVELGLTEVLPLYSVICPSYVKVFAMDKTFKEWCVEIQNRVK